MALHTTVTTISPPEPLIKHHHCLSITAGTEVKVCQLKFLGVISKTS